MIVALLGLVVALIIAGVVCWGAWELIKLAPLPAPFRILVTVVVVIVCVLIVWYFAQPLLSAIPEGPRPLR